MFTVGKRIKLIALAALLPHDIMLAQAAASQPLYLADVYESARVLSPRAGAARMLARAARAQISQAKLPPDPEIQLGFMNRELPGLGPMDPLGMTQLQVMQMIPTAGKLGAAGAAAAANASAADERARDIEWEVRAGVAMQFYDIYATDRALEVNRGTIRLLQDIRAVAEAMYRVGDGRQADVLRAQVEIARMVEDTLRMTAMRQAMAARLNALLDRPATAPVGSPILPALPDSLATVDSLVAAAERERPMVRAAARDVDAASARLRLARREIWPDLTLGVQLGQRGTEMGTERMGSLMVGATVPVFYRSRQYRMREEMTAMEQMARAELSEMRARTRGDVAVAHAQLTRAQNLAELYRGTIIPQAEAAVTSALAAYRVGNVDFMTLLDDRMTVNRYRQELFALEAEQGKAIAELEMLVGRQLFDPRGSDK